MNCPKHFSQESVSDGKAELLPLRGKSGLKFHGHKQKKTNKLSPKAWKKSGLAQIQLGDA